MLLGLYKNFEDLENSLCIEELNLLLNTNRKLKHQEYQMLGSFQGAELPDWNAGSVESQEERMARVERRAQARIRGVSEDQVLFNSLEIDYEVESETQ